jgi:hypothetical protein
MFSPCLRAAVAAALWGACAAAAACGNASHAAGADAAETTSDDGQSDSAPPEFRDVRVELVGEYAMLVDLNSGPAAPIIPEPVPASFTVFVTDDRSAAESLAVTLLDQDSEEPVAGQVATFSNGLWHIETMVEPGSRLVVRAADEAGNVSVWKHALAVPTLTEAVQGRWITRFFDVQRACKDGWESEWQADGTWEESRESNTVVVGGGWSIDEDVLTVTETWRADRDANAATVEWQRVCRFYVDDVYLHECPYLRMGEGDDIVGTWERSFQESALVKGMLSTVRDVTETWTFEEDGTWKLEQTGLADAGSGLEPTDAVTNGTYEVVLNDNYVDDFGDFLLLNAAPARDPQAEPETTVVLFRVRADRFLSDMKVRQQR